MHHGSIVLLAFCRTENRFGKLVTRYAEFLPPFPPLCFALFLSSLSLVFSFRISFFSASLGSLLLSSLSSIDIRCIRGCSVVRFDKSTSAFLSLQLLLTAEPVRALSIAGSFSDTVRCTFDPLYFEKIVAPSDSGASARRRRRITFRAQRRAMKRSSSIRVP